MKYLLFFLLPLVILFCKNNNNSIDKSINQKTAINPTEFFKSLTLQVPQEFSFLRKKKSEKKIHHIKNIDDLVELSNPSRDCYQNILFGNSVEFTYESSVGESSIFIEEWIFDKNWFKMDRKENISCYDFLFDISSLNIRHVVVEDKVYVVRSKRLNNSSTDVKKIRDWIFKYKALWKKK